MSLMVLMGLSGSERWLELIRVVDVEDKDDGVHKSKEEGTKQLNISKSIQVQAVQWLGWCWIRWRRSRRLRRE